MDKLLEKYLAEIQAAIPLARACSLIFLLLLEIRSHGQIRLSLARDMLSLGLDDFNLSDGYFVKNAMVGDLVVAVVLMTVSSSVYLLVAKGFTRFIWKKVDVNKRRDAELSKYPSVSEVPVDIRKEILVSARLEFAARLKRVRGWYQIGEAVLTIGVSLLFFSFYSGLEDGLIGLFLTVIASIPLVISFLIYLRYAVPYEIHVSALSGVPLNDGMSSL